MNLNLPLLFLRNFRWSMLGMCFWILTMPLSMQAQGTIKARVWDDANANGRQDNGEPPIANVQVNLTKPGGAFLETQSTDASGEVEFTTSEPNVRMKFFLVDNNHAYTTQDVGSNESKDSDVDNNGRTDVFTPTGTITDIDCGLLTPGSIRSFVWDDRNANGRQDNGEPGLPGVDVRLERGGGTLITTVQTDANGIAFFDGVVPAKQNIQLDVNPPNPDFKLTDQDQGSNEGKDSDGNVNGETADFQVIGSGNTKTDVDFGILTYGTIKSFVWDDANANGRQDNGEKGISGLLVRLERGGGNLITSVMTDSAGFAIFNNVVPPKSPVQLDVDLPSNDFDMTDKGQGSNASKDSDADGNGETDNFQVIGSGNTRTDIDLGVLTLGTIRTFVWDDRNGNGRQDNGEGGLSGVQVRLERGGGNLITMVSTNANGYAVFDKVVPARKDVRLDFELKDSDHAFTYQDQGSNEGKDSDAERNNGETASFQVIGSGNTRTDVDCGQWIPGEIRSFVWHDANNNGRQDNGEIGMPNVRVELRRPGGALQDVAVSDLTGIATFKDVPADRSFHLRYDIPTYATDLTTANSGSNDSKDSDPNMGTRRVPDFQTVRGNQNPGNNIFAFDITSIDAGYTGVDFDLDSDNDHIPDFLDKYPNDNTNNNLGTVLTFVWDDRDGNGKQNNNEPGIGNVTVKLRRASNNSQLQRSFTHPYNGLVAFFDIQPGSQVRLEYTRPAGHAFAQRNVGSNDNIDSDVNTNNGRSPDFTTPAGVVVKSFDAGMFAPGKVVARVWDDQDGNGKQNNNEPGIESITVKLRRASNNSVIQTKTTGTNGIVTFNNVPAEISVRLEFDEPNGHRFTQRNVGNNESIDSDANTNNGRSPDFRMRKGSDVIDFYDAGLFVPGTVVSRVWDDQDGNGKQNNNEPGIEDVIVKLRRASNNSVIQTKTTGTNGIVTFNNVPADISVRLEFDEPSGHRFTQRNVGNNESIDSDAHTSNGRSPDFRMRKGSDVIDFYDAGLFVPGTVVSRVWDDQDGNGKQNNNEPGIEDVVVKLRRASNNSVIQTKTTGMNGIVTFNNVPADILVRLEFGKPNGHRFTQRNVGNNEAIDSDAHTSNGRSPDFQMRKGSDVIDFYDAGLFAPGEIITRVWDDQDGNGKQNNNEPGIRGVTVKLRRASNNSMIQSTITGLNGEATFEDVPADISVRLEYILPNGHSFTQRNVGNNDNIDSDANVNNGRSPDFMLTKGSEKVEKFDAGMFAPGIVTTKVWDDLDGNGKLNGSEPGVESVTVKLRRASNNSVISTDNTDAGGVAQFFDVPTDIQVYLEYVLPSGYTFTTRNTGSNDNIDSDANVNNGRSQTFQLVQGSQNRTDIDAGLRSSVAPRQAAPAAVVAQGLNMYPVPVIDNAMITLTATESADATYRIIDMTGRTLQQAAWTLQPGENRVKISAATLATGQYQLVVEVNGTILTHTFSVLR